MMWIAAAIALVAIVVILTLAIMWSKTHEKLGEALAQLETAINENRELYTMLRARAGAAPTLDDLDRMYEPHPDPSP